LIMPGIKLTCHGAACAPDCVEKTQVSSCVPALRRSRALQELMREFIKSASRPSYCILEQRGCSLTVLDVSYGSLRALMLSYQGRSLIIANAPIFSFISVEVAGTAPCVMEEPMASKPRRAPCSHACLASCVGLLSLNAKDVQTTRQLSIVAVVRA